LRQLQLSPLRLPGYRRSPASGDRARGTVMMRRAAVLALFMLTAAAAPRDAMLVSTQWLADNLDDPNLVVLHVGAPDSYALHIPGARHALLSDIAASGDAATLEMLPAAELRLRLSGLGIGDRSRIVVYYADPMPQAATRVVFTLDA